MTQFRNTKGIRATVWTMRHSLCHIVSLDTPYCEPWYSKPGIPRAQGKLYDIPYSAIGQEMRKFPN